MITMTTFGNPKVGGRLGNQLFQLSSMIGLAERFEHNLFMPEWKYAQYFDIEVPVLNEQNLLGLSAVHESKFHFDLDQFNGLNLAGSYDVKGYLQSEKYFGTQKLKFTDKYVHHVRQKYKDSFDDKETIAIHVRRGDYVGNAYYYQLQKEYFKAAIEQIDDYFNKKVLVFTDDPEYCESEFVWPVIYTEGNDIEDLCLMSLCDYHILSNSTFGWWGAYLSNSKRVIRPGKYFTDRMILIKDFWPSDWIEYDYE